MSDERNGFGEAVAIWAVLASAVLAAAIGALFATVPAWGWAALTAYVLLSGLALLSFTDLASRSFLAGTLRNRTYTQIYTTLTRRLILPIWAALCDEPGRPKQMERERIPAATLFRHALTWRLYDKALLIAVAYPVLLPVLQWLVTGETARIGSFEFLPAAPFWWERATVLGVLAGLLLGFAARLMARASRYAVLRKAADRLPLVAVFAAIVAAAATEAPVPLAGAAAVTLAMAIAIALAAAGAAAAPASAAVAVVGAFLVAFDADAQAETAAVMALALVLAGAIAVSVAAFLLDRAGRPRAGRWLLTLTLAGGAVLYIRALDFGPLAADARALFLLLAVLPLLNALFDTLSYAVTLTLMRRGLRSRLPLLWGLLDLLLACLLFLALGATLIVVIHWLNTLAGLPLVDLPALLAGIHTEPLAYLWLYAMLFSTILPTALHGLLSLLGVQGLWPRAWRRPVAGWVEGATASTLAYLRAGLALGVIWTLPLVALGGLLWLLWSAGGGVAAWALGRYFDLLLRLAAIPVGAL